MRLRSGLGCNAGARRGSAGSSSLVTDLPGTLVRRGDPALYDQPIGVERVDFDVGELVAGNPKLELREVSAAQDQATSPRLLCESRRRRSSCATSRPPSPS